MSGFVVAAVSAIVAALCLVPIAAGAAPIYSWTDEQGRRQISDRPPEGSVKDLKVRGARPASASESTTAEAKAPAAAPARASEKKGATLNEKALDFNKRQLEREESRAKQEKADAEARDRAQRCEQAQGYLRNLRAGGRATRLDPKTGERLFLDDKEREREILEASRSADAWCRQAPSATTRVPAPK